VNWVDSLGLWAGGFGIEISTINPFTSGGGGAYGINLEYTSTSGWHLYKYSTPNNTSSLGFAPGICFSGNLAMGTGDWTGPFENGTGNLGPITGGYFQSPPDESEPGYFGGSLGIGIGFPADLGFTPTTYYRMSPDKF
jgi:hypothetical protein